MLIKRLTKIGANDLINVYRPHKLDEVIGNKINVNILKNSILNKKLEHKYLFVGNRGCGKTTFARMIALAVNCKDRDDVSEDPCLECTVCKATMNGSNMDVIEINVGNANKKNDVERIVSTFPDAPMLSRNKVVIFDEAHKLTTAAQELLLKIIEDGYSYIYFLFCTNKPEKLSDTFLSRVNILNFNPLSFDETKELLVNIAEFEGMSYEEPIIDIIVDESGYIPREAIKLLGAVNSEGSWSKDVVYKLCASVDEDGTAFGVFEIGKHLEKGSFRKALNVYDKIKNSNSPETLRIILYGFFTASLRRAKNKINGAAYSNILTNVLNEPIFDVGKIAQNKFVNILFRIYYILEERKKSESTTYP